MVKVPCQVAVYEEAAAADVNNGTVGPVMASC